MLRLENLHALTGYGEHPHVEEAFAYVAEDYTEGCLEYKDVYGKVREHYLTGSPDASSPLDEWLLRGGGFNTSFLDDTFVFVLTGYEHTPTPDGYQQRAIDGEEIVWSSRGYTYKISKNAFADNVPCAYVQVTDGPGGCPGSDPWMYQITKTGRATTLPEAIEQALLAHPVETKESPS